KGRSGWLRPSVYSDSGLVGVLQRAATGDRTGVCSCDGGGCDGMEGNNHVPIFCASALGVKRRHWILSRAWTTIAHANKTAQTRQVPMNPLKIDLYTEISCPWCIIGQHRLDKVLAENFASLAVDIEHHPVILMPDCPPAGLRIADLMRSRYGITDQSAAWQRPHAEARLAGLQLDLNIQPMAYPTLAAHTLIRLARTLGTQHALAMAFSDAYFMRAMNIGDAAVLADIAVNFGFDRAQALHVVQDANELALTQQQVAAAAARGIRSVPHFIIAGQWELNGSPTAAELIDAIATASAA